MKQLTDKIISFGMDHAVTIPVSMIRFEPSLIELCEANHCGNYKKNWTCPPYVGKTDDLIRNAKAFSNILVFQKVYRLTDSFDIEGMTEGNKDFRRLTEMVQTSCKSCLERYLLLGAGGCRICDVCTAVENKPCLFPDRAFASLESYGIQVSSLAEACGMKYINGQNTTTFFGGVLY